MIWLFRVYRWRKVICFVRGGSEDLHQQNNTAVFDQGLVLSLTIGPVPLPSPQSQLFIATHKISTFVKFQVPGLHTWPAECSILTAKFAPLLNTL